MNKLYCYCGQPTEYTLNKPKRCQACGELFEGSSASAKPATPTFTPKPIIPRPAPAPVARPKYKQPEVVISQDDAESATSVPEVQGLDVEVVPAKIRRGERLGDIAFTGTDSGFKREKPKRVSKKEIMENFRKEAGNSKESIEIN